MNPDYHESGRRKRGKAARGAGGPFSSNGSPSGAEPSEFDLVQLAGVGLRSAFPPVEELNP